MLRLYTHPACLQHLTGQEHPESPARLQAVLAALGHDDFASISHMQTLSATRGQLLRVHRAEHVGGLLQVLPETGLRALDGVTRASPAAGRAALCASACKRVDSSAPDRLIRQPPRTIRAIPSHRPSHYAARHRAQVRS